MKYTTRGMLFDCVVISVLCSTLVCVLASRLNSERRVWEREAEHATRFANMLTTQERMREVSDAIKRLLADVGMPALYTNPQAPEGERQLVLLAVSLGETPKVNPEVESIWGWPVDGVKVDLLNHHLSYNTPGGKKTNAYATWHGGYQPFVGADGWGNRIMVNAGYLPGGEGSPWDVVVLSAGADGQVDSRFTQDGFVIGDDDLVCLISPGGVTHKDTPATPPAWALPAAQEPVDDTETR